MESTFNGRDGLLVEPGDVDGLARAIGSLAASPERRRELSVAALERVRLHFDVTSLCPRVQQGLLEVSG